MRSTKKKQNKKRVGLLSSYFQMLEKKCNIDTFNRDKQEVTRTKTRKDRFTCVLPGCGADFYKAQCVRVQHNGTSVAADPSFPSILHHLFSGEGYLTIENTLSL